VIRADGVVIRAFEDDDMAALFAFRQDYEASHLAYVGVLPERLDDLREFVRNVRASGTDEMWTIADAQGKALGIYNIYSIDWVNHTLYTASSIFSPEMRGRGIGTTARRLVLDFVFNRMGIQRCYGEYLTFNDASRRAHEKVGAEVAGVRKQAYLYEGRLVDVVVYQVRRERFNALHGLGGGPAPSPR
jgi:RimJ/RimL family protein N-acetyltransferase